MQRQRNFILLYIVTKQLLRWIQTVIWCSALVVVSLGRQHKIFVTGHKGLGRKLPNMHFSSTRTSSTSGSTITPQITLRDGQTYLRRTKDFDQLKTAIN